MWSEKRHFYIFSISAQRETKQNPKLIKQDYPFPSIVLDIAARHNNQLTNQPSKLNER